METPVTRRPVLASACAALTVSFASGLAAPVPAAGQVPDDAASDIRAFAERALERAPVVPGFALTVVADGAALIVDGFGSAHAASGTPVTDTTVFYIASSTKSFVGMTAAILAGRGELDLDAPLSRAIPGLSLTPPVDADAIPLVRALTHDLGFDNSGVVYRTAFTGLIERADLLRVLAGYTRERPRGFDYDNLGYVLTGWAIEHATGLPWQRALEREVLRPLGMERTSAYVSQARRWAMAAGHVTGADAAHQAIEFAKTDDSMAPAGGMVTSGRDMVPWLLANLNEGRLAGRQALPAAAVRAAHQPRIEVDATFYRFHRTGYGLGWYSADYEGDRLVHHFGGFPGWAAHISFMPEHGIGVAVLGNAGSATYLSMIAAYAYDRLLGKSGLDGKYAAELERFAEGMRQQRETAATAAPTDSARVTPARPLTAYAGTYVNDRLGPFVVRASARRLIADFGALGGTMVPFGADTFRVELLPGMSATTVFAFDARGNATGFDWGGRPFPRAP